MTESGYYPAGAEFDSKAPWNQVDPEAKTIKVTISQTLSKTVEIEVDDYEEYPDEDEDGICGVCYDFSNCDLRAAVKEQVELPSDKFKDWEVDDMEIVRED